MNGNGGFFSDASGLANLADSFANVPVEDGLVIQGDTNGDGTVEADPDTNIEVDASNIVIPGGTSGASVSYQWTLISDPGDGEVTKLGAVADSAGSLNGTYFTISSPTADYYVWIDVDDANTGDPALAGLTGIEVEISANASAINVASALEAAFAAVADFDAEVDTATLTDVIVTNVDSGDVTDAADGAVPTGFSFTFTDGTGGVTINSDTSAILDFGANVAGSYEWELTVTVLDASGNPVVVPGYTDANGEVVASVVVDVQEIDPVADAGGDQSVVGTAITLDGSGSFDPNGGVDSFTYSWSAVDQDGNAVPVTAWSGGTFPTPGGADTSGDPTFTPGSSGVYTVTLEVTKTDDSLLTDSQSVQVIINDPSDLLPVADPGDPRTARTGSTVTLYGTASADPEGDVLTYEWNVESSPEAVTFSDETAMEPTFIPSLPGSYVFSLVVTDDAGAGLKSAPETVTIQVVDDQGDDVRRPPAAVAQAVGLERAVFLDNLPSNLDATSFVLADGSTVTASFSDSEADTSDDPAAGTTDGLTAVQVVVNGVLEATVYAELADDDPALTSLEFRDGSSAQVYAFGRAGDSFVLDGSLSQDDGAVVALTWTQTGGEYQFDTLTGNLISVVPQAAGTLTFELTVEDNIGLSSLTDELVVYVLPAGLTTPAGPPTAVVDGSTGTTLVDGVLVADPGSITLDAGDSTSLASGQFATGTVTYFWEQVSGPTALITDAAVAAADIDLQTEGPHAFRVTVTDANGVSDSEIVWISVSSPTADAPVALLADVASQTIPEEGSVTLQLDANLSSGSLPLSYIWSQSAGVPYVVESSGSTGTVTVDQPGTYTFLVRVVNGDGVVSPPAEVTVVLRATPESALASGGSDVDEGGCSLAPSSAASGPGLGASLLSLLVLLLLGGRRRWSA
jgi:hypothetical protein